MIKDQIISFETAKLAKKANTNLESYDFYTHRGDVCHSEVFEDQSEYDGSYIAVTQSLLQKWFREMQNIHITPLPSTYNSEGKVTYDCHISIITKDRENESISKFLSLDVEGSYEEILELGLQESFKYIEL